MDGSVLVWCSVGGILLVAQSKTPSRTCFHLCCNACVRNGGGERANRIADRNRMRNAVIQSHHRPITHTFHPSYRGFVVFLVSTAFRVSLPSWLMSPLLLLWGWWCPALHPRLLRSRRLLLLLLLHVLLLTRTGALWRVHRSDSRHCWRLRISSRSARNARHSLVSGTSVHGAAALAVMKLGLWMSLLRMR